MKKSILILIFFFSCLSIYAQKIDKSKKELNSSTSQSNSSTSSSKSTSRNNVDQDDVPFLLKIAGYITYGILIGDYTNEDHLNFELTAYPYKGNSIGNYCEQCHTRNMGKTQTRDT